MTIDRKIGAGAGTAREQEEERLVHIITTHDGPRKEDVAIKRFLGENRGTIDRIKQALTGGGLGQGLPKVEAPAAAQIRSFGYRRTDPAPEAAPYVRISPNGRVVVADYETGRQLHHLGDLRGPTRARRFVLATRDNGFFAPLDTTVADPLLALDGASMTEADAEDALKIAIAERLGLAR